MMANEAFLPLDELAPALDDMQRALRNQDSAGALAILRALVPEYAPTGPSVDEIQCEAPTLPARPLSLVQTS